MALEPGCEQSQDAAGDVSSLQHLLTQAAFPGVIKAAERLQGGTE